MVTSWLGATVKRGIIQVFERIDEDEHRHVLVIAGLRPHPWTAFARARRKSAGIPFATWQAMTRDSLKAALRASGTAPYPRTAVLGAAMAFGARRETMPGQTRATSVLTWDLRNLEKALEDACKGVLWHDDDQVRFSGPGSAIDTDDDWWALHVWDGARPWQEAWAELSVPVVELSENVRRRESSVLEPQAAVAG